MNKIKKALNEVKASEEIKLNTLNYIENYHKPKRSYYAFAFAMVFVLSLFFSYEFLLNPVMAIEIDGDTKLSLSLNRLNQVIDIKGDDAIAKEIIEKHNLKFQNYNEVVSTILNSDEMVDIIASNGTVEINVEGNNKGQCHRIQNEMNECTSRAYKHHQANIDEDDKQILNQYNLSVGQLKAYEELCKYTDDYTIEDIQDLKPNEIRKLVKEYKHRELPTN